MLFNMPFLGNYSFDTDGNCFDQKGASVRKCKGDYYKLTDDEGEYNVVTVEEIVQYGKHLFPDMHTIALAITYPTRKSKANTQDGTIN